MKIKALVLVMAAMAAAGGVQAQDAEETAEGWSFGGSVTAVSDYVWRGVSQSNEDAAVQLDLYFEHAGGFYAGLWSSSVDFTGADEEDDGIDIEVNPYIGYTAALTDSIELDVIFNHVAYPGYREGYDYRYNELEATLNFANGLHTTVAYSNDIFNLGGKGLYYQLGGAWDLGDSGFGVKAHVGHYDLESAAGDSYQDFQVGVTRAFGPVNAELAYSDTSSYGDELSEALDDAALADGRVVLSLAIEF